MDDIVNSSLTSEYGPLGKRGKTMVNIEAETFDEAIKEAKKQKRIAKKQEAMDKIDGELAYLRAQAALGYIVQRVFGNFHLWLKEARITRIDEHHISCQFEAEVGTASTVFYGYLPEQVLLNGAGFAVGVMAKDLDLGSHESWSALGICKDRVALIEIPEPIVRLMIEKFDEKKQQQIA